MIIQKNFDHVPNKINKTTNISTSSVFVGNKEDFGNFQIKNNTLERVNGGLNWFVASIFLLADMAGGGIVAVPIAITKSSFFVGIFLLCLMGLMATITSVLLGKAWFIMLKRYPNYRTHCRKPYAEMGYRAFGPKIRDAASFCVNFTQFGASVVFLLLSAKNITDFVNTKFNTNFSVCLMIVILSLCLLPITLLKSPQDFWPVIILGMLSTLIAVILICYGAWRDRECYNKQSLSSFTFDDTFGHLGTLLFSFGGHSTFPTIQVDMKRPEEFDKSSYFGFLIVLFINLIVGISGSIVYGESLYKSVINSLQIVEIQQAVNIMIAAHCLLTVTLIINPINQEFEESFKLPHGFSIKRILLRTGMMFSVAFISILIPDFEPVMGLIGGSTIVLTSLVFPPLFYLILSTSESEKNDPSLENITLNLSEPKNIGIKSVWKRTNKLVFILCILIIVFGLAFGTSAVVSSFKSFSIKFEKSCYLTPFFNEEKTKTNNALNCCGTNFDFSIYNQTCSNHD